VRAGLRNLYIDSAVCSCQAVASRGMLARNHSSSSTAPVAQMPHVRVARPRPQSKRYSAQFRDVWRVDQILLAESAFGVRTLT
jgi:hypothetical protein